MQILYARAISLDKYNTGSRIGDAAGSVIVAVIEFRLRQRFLVLCSWRQIQ